LKGKVTKMTKPQRIINALHKIQTENKKKPWGALLTIVIAFSALGVVNTNGVSAQSAPTLNSHSSAFLKVSPKNLKSSSLKVSPTQKLAPALKVAESKVFKEAFFMPSEAVLLKASKVKSINYFPKRAVINANARRDEWLKSDRTVIPHTPRAYAVNMLHLYKWDMNQWACLDRLWWHESNWNFKSGHIKYGAYGIAQAYPADKMDVTGTDWKANPYTQVRWGMQYIASRYDTPCKTLTLWGQRATNAGHGWY
jgi:hypothetical protein